MLSQTHQCNYKTIDAQKGIYRLNSDDQIVSLLDPEVNQNDSLSNILTSKRLNSSQINLKIALEYNFHQIPNRFQSRFSQNRQTLSQFFKKQRLSYPKHPQQLPNPIATSASTYQQYQYQNFRYYFYMQDRSVAEKKVIIPNAFHKSGRQREEAEQAKVLGVVKSYLAPNRETKPLGLPVFKEVREDRTDIANCPLFDKFDLSAIYSQRVMTQEEFCMWHPDDSIDPQRFQTPVRHKPAYQTVGGFKRCDLTNTRATSKHFKSVFEGKKSRPKQKGLRKLSQRAYEIVLNMHSASYKEVANKLVDQLNNQKELDQEGKDEQNIKRRVYDALNVLIALGVLTKEGRKIVGDRDLHLQFAAIDKERLSAELAIKKQAVRRKQRQLKLLSREQKIWQKLLQRNQQRETIEKVVTLPFMFIKNVDPNNVEFSNPKGEYLSALFAYQQQKRIFKSDIDIFQEYQSLKESEMSD